MEGLERVGLFSHRDELDGLTRDLSDREGTATAGVAIKLGHDDAIEVHALGELPDDVHDVLSAHRIDDHEDLVGLDRMLDVDGLAHHLLVDLQASGRVHDHNVVEVIDSLPDGS